MVIQYRLKSTKRDVKNVIVHTKAIVAIRAMAVRVTVIIPAAEKSLEEMLASPIATNATKRATVGDLNAIHKNRRCKRSFILPV